MELKGFNNHWYDLFPDILPEIILTRDEAIARGLNPDLKKGKGYYTTINGTRIPITIKK